MAIQNTSKRNTTKKKAAKPVPMAGKAGDVDEDDVSRKTVARVCTGLIMLFVAFFMTISFISWIYSGASDFSLVDDGMDYGKVTAHNEVSNKGGYAGLVVSYFLINKCFGLASFCIPVFLVIVALWLIGSFRFHVFRDFVKLSLFMVWASIVLGVTQSYILPDTDIHYSLGGNHGLHIHGILKAAIGGIGELGLILLSVVFVLIYFSTKIVGSITEFFRFKRIRALRAKWGHKYGQADGADADDTETEKPASASGDDEENGENQTEDGSDKADGESGHSEEDDNERTLTYHFDDEEETGGEEDSLRDGTAGTETKPEETVKTEPESTLDKEENGKSQPAEGEMDLASRFDQVVARQSKVDAQSAAAPVVAPGFTVEVAKETEQAHGEIDRGSIDTPYDPRLELAHYKFPPVSLLEKNTDSNPQIDVEEQRANKERIIKVLRSFGVEIRDIKATIGPTITLYEVTPGDGVRINKIRNLEDDIALNLAAEGVRIIAPIPGKGTVGIEVPNKRKCIVSMESVINSRTFQESKMELPCALGKTITNEVFMVDLAKAPHMLVAGATGMGKSVGLNAIVTSLLYKKHPSELKIVMVDPKKVEFSIYAPIANQYLAKLEDEEEAIITNNDRVVKTLNALCKLMDDRYLLLKNAHVRNIKEYNAKFKARQLSPLQGHEYMPYYVVIIDEFGDLIMTAGKEIELPICRIAQLARAVGIHMIIATQRPTTRIITGTIKANFPARIAFKVSAMMDSRIILDRPGAQQLIGRGDMLFLQSADPVRVQCAFVDTPEVARICDFISKQQQYPDMTYLPEPPCEDGEGGAKDVDLQHLDSMFGEVARMVVGQNAGSTSFIQRKFSIGYNRAGRLMDQLEKAGIVGAQNGSKPREVLVTDLMTLESMLENLGVN